jgi:hypothetical protein
MEFFYRNATPVYRGATPTASASSCGLGWLTCGLFRAPTPAYEGTGGVGAQSSWWLMSTATPAYRTVPDDPDDDGDDDDDDCETDIAEAEVTT